MTLQEILQHFENVKQVSENQYSANCSSCGKESHLYLSENDGIILADCKKGCEFASIVQACGLRPSDFFPKKSDRTKWIRLREHIYTDTEGTPIARKIIYDKGDGKKTAVWERYENECFLKGLNKMKVPPYHVHNLDQCRTVLIAEGEKDVETLEKMGYYASCSPHGAGGRTSWSKDLNAYFKEKTVIILMDNDEAGREHGRMTAEHLYGVAENIRLIPSERIYPELKEKGDISDIVQAVGLEEARKLLIEAVKKAEYYKPEQTAVRSGSAADYNADGTEELTIENLSAYLRQKGIEVWYNTISHSFEIDGFGGESQDHLKETAPALIYDELHFQLKKCSMDKIGQYLNVIATRNKRNPILEMIQNTQWDGRSRIEEIYRIFGIDEADHLSRTILRKWLMQCICGLHNTMENPFSLDIVLIFQGAQGIGKTRFLEKLALNSHYFGEGRTFDPRNKDSQIECTSKWICELGEIGSTMKKDIDSLKAFLTNSTDEYRLPYGKAALRYARLTSFCGTTNDRQFLIDETGNRRFATISLRPDVQIDYETQVKPFDSLQLWAEVNHLVETAVANGSSYAACFRLNRGELADLNTRNAEHQKLMKGEAEVIDILAEESMEEAGYTIEQEYMTVVAFMELHPVLRRYSSAQIGKVLEKLGYPFTRRRINGSAVPLKVRKLPHKIRRNYNQNNY